MTLEELGSALEAERKRRGLSIEDVADRLKISPRILRAIESGDESAFPHKAYGRGFVRSYAGLLGMSAEELDSVPPPEVGETSLREEPYGAVATGGGWLKWFFLLVLALVVAAGAIYLNKGDELFRFSSSQPRQVATPVLPEEPAPMPPMKGAALPEAPRPAPRKPAPPVSPVSRPAPAMEAGAPGTVRGQEQAPDAARADAAENSSGEKAGRAGPEPQPAATGEELGSQHRVVIIATEECWIHSNADKMETRQFSLRKGDTFALTFVKSLDLKLGNAGGVRIRYDGQDLGPAGSDGQVRTISFPPAAREQ